MAHLAPRAIQHGHHIFVYNNIRTNQVVYSLTRALNVRYLRILFCLSFPQH